MQGFDEGLCLDGRSAPQSVEMMYRYACQMTHSCEGKEEQLQELALGQLFGYFSVWALLSLQRAHSVSCIMDLGVIEDR